MAVFKSTKKAFPMFYDQGKLYYNCINSESLPCISVPNAIFSGFNMNEFYTENQKGYYNRMTTWAWFKCFISANACADILTSTELANHVEHFACLTHDKDKNEDGSLKPTHTHVLVKFFRNEQCAKLVDYFHCDNCSNALNNKYNRFMYLRHDSDQCRKEGKYQYSWDELVCDDIDFFKNLEATELDSTPMTIIDCIIAGKSERYMVNTFGERYVQNKAKYRDCARQIAYEEGLLIESCYDVIEITPNVITIYDKCSNQLVDICRDYESARVRLEGLSRSLAREGVKC